MISTKEIKIIIYKQNDFRPVHQKVLNDAATKITEAIRELVNRFDGEVNLTIFIKGKGNA